ncbi:MAG: hypothetical protein Fur003_5870 [Candidatus Dojkabacteria bacterium]
MKELFGILSIIVGFITYIIGVRSVLKGEFKPQRMTRFLYALIGLIFFASLVVQNRGGVLLALAQAIGGVVLFILSIKFGVGGKSKSDLIVLTGALISLLMWKLTSNATLALILSIITDLIAFWPTVRKIWQSPETEEWKFYCSDILAGALSILSLKSFAFPGIIYPLYIFLINLFATSLILLRRFYLKR